MSSISDEVKKDGELSNAISSDSNGNPHGDLHGSKEKGAARDHSDDDLRDDETQILHGVKLMMTIIALIISMLVHSIDQTIVTVSLFTIGDQFNDFGKISWITTGYILPSAALSMNWGKISIIFGRKWTLLTSLVFFAVGSIIAALSTNMDMLIGGRVISGIGGSGISTLAVVVISEIVPVHKRGLAQSAIGASFGIASVVGPLVGGALTKTATGWPSIFWLGLGVSGLAFVLILFFFNPPLPKGSTMDKLKQIDYLGNFLLTAGLTLVLLALNFASSSIEPWDSAIVISFFVVGGVLEIVYFLWNFSPYCKYPMLPWEVVKIPQVLAPTFCITFLFGGFIVVVVYTTIFFQVAWGYDPMEAGLHLLPIILSVVVFSIIGGVVITKTRYIKPVALFGCTVCSIGVGVMTLLDENSNSSQKIGLLILPGVGVGCMFQSTILAAQLSAPAVNSGEIIATSLVQFGRSIGGTIGSTVGQAILSLVFAADVAHLQLPPGVDPDVLINQPALIHQLPTELMNEVIHEFADAWRKCMYFTLAFVLTAWICTLFLTNRRVPAKKSKPKNDEESAVASIGK